MHSEDVRCTTLVGACTRRLHGAICTVLATASLSDVSANERGVEATGGEGGRDTALSQVRVGSSYDAPTKKSCSRLAPTSDWNMAELGSVFDAEQRCVQSVLRMCQSIRQRTSRAIGREFSSAPFIWLQDVVFHIAICW